MEAQRRRELIEQRVLSDGEAGFKALAIEFDVSEMTIRRDLEALAERGVVRRVSGGVIAAIGTSIEPSLKSRALTGAREKVHVAAAAVAHIKAGETVLLDSGSTALAVARAIAGRRLGLTIVTPSLLVALELHDDAGTKILVTGGLVRPGELSLVGADSIDALGRYNCDTFVMGVSGVDGERGFTDYSHEEGAVKRAGIRASERVIVVADASKLGRVHLANVACADAVDVLVTDGRADHPTLAGLRAANVEIDAI